MSAPIIVAVDGGNSKTDVVLADADGAVLAMTTGPSSSPHILGVPGSLDLLDRLIGEVRAAAGIPQLPAAPCPAQCVRQTRTRC